MPNVKISILMPTYNGMKYLEHAIGSVLSQEYRDWELIISDDGSTDGTRDYLAALNDPRIVVHFQARNLNIFGNLNFLFSQAKGEIVQILCQDDYFTADDSLDRILAEWATLPQEVAFLRMNHTSEGNKGLARIEGPILPPTVRPNESDLLFFIFGCIPGNLSNVSVRMSLVQDAGMFRTDLPYAGDFEFWSRLGHVHPWSISKIKAVHVRGHSDQASRTLNTRGELMPQMAAVLGALYPRLVEEGHSVFLLRLLATLNYVSQHRYAGVRALLKGRGGEYLTSVSKSFDKADFAFGALGGWVVFFASLGGRIFTPQVARQLLKSP